MNELDDAIFSGVEISMLRERYSRLYSGVVYDALFVDVKPEHPYVLSRKIMPAYGFDSVLCGPAFTVRGSMLPDRNPRSSKSIEMYESMYDGCVEVISAGMDRKISVFGEITAMIVERQGAAGTIVDACTRDIKNLRENSYKIFSTGVSMVDSIHKWRVLDYQIAVSLDGEDGDVWINPGDYIFADPDGALVIPRKDVWNVLEIAEKRAIRENRMRELIKEGISPRELREREGRW